MPNLTCSLDFGPFPPRVDTGAAGFLSKACEPLSKVSSFSSDSVEVDPAFVEEIRTPLSGQFGQQTANNKSKSVTLPDLVHATLATR